MTRTADHGGIPPGARRDAANAAGLAGVSVRPVGEVADLRAVAGLFALIWESPVVPPMPHDLMRSLVHAGGAVHAAYRGGRLVGAAVAVFGPPATASCYSLIAGVSPEVAGGGIGLALKLAQREWALAAGTDSMTWTFDPLLRRNARFNLSRLGATVTGYLTDFYGEITDGVNDPETDRLAVTWDLRVPLPGGHPASGTVPASAPGASPAAPGGEPPAILATGPGGEPVASRSGATRVVCQTPHDILALRRADPALARRWRLALRDALGGALSAGYRVTGLAEPGWYVLEQEEAHG